MHRFTPTSLRLAGGLLAWIATFTFLYVFAAVACARNFANARVLGLPLIPTVSIACALVAAVVIARLVLQGWRGYKRQELDEHARFIGFVTFASGALGLVALALLLLPPLLVSACHRA